jgi:hypothetical protein
MWAVALSRGACPQSYPQDLWIVEKALMKPRVTWTFQVLLEKYWGIPTDVSAVF